MPLLSPVEDIEIEIANTEFYTTFAQWEKNPPAEPIWLVGDLLTSGGVSLFAAKPKTGKSIMGRQLTWCIASGRYFLNKAVNDPGNALYIGMEDDYGYVLNHFRLMGAEPAETRLAIAGAVADTMEGRLKQLEEAIREHDLRFVFIDPYARFLSILDTSGSGYGEMTEKSQAIIDLARKYNCHIAGSWHHTKGDPLSDRGTDAVFGNIQTVGFVDTIVQLWGNTDTNERNLKMTQRYAAPQEPWAISLDDKTLTFRFDGTSREFKNDRAVVAILDFCQDGEWYTGTTFEKLPGLKDHKRRSEILGELVKQGKLVTELRRAPNNKLVPHYRLRQSGSIAF